MEIKDKAQVGWTFCTNFIYSMLGFTVYTTGITLYTVQGMDVKPYTVMFQTITHTPFDLNYY